MVRDLDTLRPETVFLDGPAGRLAATWERPACEPVAGVLLLHPHPLHGGTRRNNVVRYGALGALEACAGALRLDFRGAGDSEGHYDEGRGEIEDAACALRWLRERLPDLPLFVWGFSFGSRVGLHLASRPEAGVEGWLGVACPSAIYPWPELQDWPQRMALLAGTRDDFVDFERYAPALERGAALHRVEGANHFFQGLLPEVRAWTARTLRSWLGTEDAPLPGVAASE